MSLAPPRTAVARRKQQFQYDMYFFKRVLNINCYKSKRDTYYIKGYDDDDDVVVGVVAAAVAAAAAAAAALLLLLLQQ